jgi:hypothetical protein
MTKFVVLNGCFRLPLRGNDDVVEVLYYNGIIELGEGIYDK